MSGVGHVACRGKARQGGRICASDILYRDGEWLLSLTVEPTAIVRGRVAHNATALDWGVETLLSCVDESGDTTEIENPRWYQSSKDHIAALQQSVARKKRGSNRRKIAARRLRRAQGKQARRRLDHLHTETNSIARQNALVAMEDLTVKNMTRSAKGTVKEPGKNVAQKAGLNREILDTAPALLMRLLRYKVLETGGMWVVAPTKKLKPSQTCPECGHQVKKVLSERVHRCTSCGHTEPRDTASARVVLNWALYGTPYKPGPGREPSRGMA